MSDLKTSVVSDLNSFESLENDWNDLLEKSNSESVFLTWDWLYPWWCKFHRGRALYIITIRDHLGVLVGIGPFCINDKWGKWPIRALTFLGGSPASSEYLDIIVDPDHQEFVSYTIFGHLCASAATWDCLIFSDMLSASCVFKYFKKFSLPKHFIVRESLLEVCPYISLELSKDATLNAFKPQLKSIIRRRANKLDKMGATLTVVESEKELAPYIDKLFELHLKCWKARGIKGNFFDDLIKSFHIDVTQHLLSSDFLRLYALQLDGNTIASLYAIQYKRTLFYFQSGFDPDWSALSPGTVLMWKCICDAIDRGAIKFDFLRGSEPYKNLWSDQTRNTYTMIFIPPNSTMTKIYFFMVDMKRVTKSIAKNMLSALGRKAT